MSEGIIVNYLLKDSYKLQAKLAKLILFKHPSGHSMRSVFRVLEIYNFDCRPNLRTRATCKGMLTIGTAHHRIMPIITNFFQIKCTFVTNLYLYVLVAHKSSRYILIFLN